MSQPQRKPNIGSTTLVAGGSDITMRLSWAEFWRQLSGARALDEQRFGRLKIAEWLLGNFAFGDEEVLYVKRDKRDSANFQHPANKRVS